MGAVYLLEIQVLWWLVRGLICKEAPDVYLFRSNLIFVESEFGRIIHPC